MEALPTSFCSFFSLKILLARILGEVDNCACPSIAPCFFGGVGGSSYPRSSSCPRSRACSIPPMVEWCTKQGYTETPFRFAVSGLCGPCSGCYAPRNLCCPCSIRPLRDGLRGGFLDLENGAIWPLNGLRAKKFHVFRIKGLDPGSTGR